MTECPSCGTENPGSAKFCNECATPLVATPLREERKVITALFCDLVGSTALGESMDHEDVARLLASYQALCRARIESHGGVVEKFIGDAVVGVFGVPAAHEDDPERAVRAALKICADVEASDLPIEVRIGVNTGEALVRLDVDPRSGVGFATGDTMNTTARLEAAAPVMGVAVSEATYRATSQAIAYAELPPLTAKGKAEPLRARRALEPISRVPDERDRTPFVGRELELGVLTQLFERSRTRPATEFATVVADPGLGKSRLVRELARHVESVPELIRWRVGRCLPYGEGIGFWALGEVIKAEAGILDADDQPTLRSKLERAVTETDPQTKAWMIDRLGPLVGLQTTTAAPEQTEAFTAWRRFLESLATQGPTAIVIEDLHWADPGFVAFLEHVAEKTAGLPLLVVVTARPEVEERHPSWPPGRRSTVLSLSPLTDQDVEALVRTSLPDASDELTAIVLERAGGSPLYAEQLAAMLTDQALPIAGAAIDEALIPASVQALIAARIDALAPEPKRVLMEAAVVGKTFWAGAIASLGDHPDLPDTLAEIVRREFCKPVLPSTIEGDAEYSFWHALVRDVAYAELTKAERVRLHAGVAAWITDRTEGQLGEEAEIVVHHLDAALALGPSAPGLETAPLTDLLGTALLAAGEAAMRTDAAAAEVFLARAMEQTEGGSSGRARASSLRGRSLHAAGRHEEAVPLLRTAFQAELAAGELDGAVASAFLLGVSLWRTGRRHEGSELLDRLETDLGPNPTSARASYRGGMAEIALSRGARDRAQVLCDEGTAICEELKIPAPGPLLDARGLLRIGRGDLDGEAEVRQAVEWYLTEGHPVAAAGSLWNLGASLGDWIGTRASAFSDEAIQLCLDRGVGDVHSFRILRAFDALLEGRWQDLEGISDLLRLARDVGNTENESIGLIVLGRAEIERAGRLPSIDRLVELSDTWDASFWIGAEGASLLVLSGDPKGIEVGRGFLKRVADEPTGVTGHWIETRAAISVGDLQLARRFASDPDAVEMPYIRADTCAAAGAVAEAEDRWDEAARRYQQAIELWDQLGYGEKLPHERIGLGRCLLQLGRVNEGVATLREARVLCERLGAKMRIAEIDRILADGDSEGTEEGSGDVPVS